MPETEPNPWNVNPNWINSTVCCLLWGKGTSRSRLAKFSRQRPIGHLHETHHGTHVLILIAGRGQRLIVCGCQICTALGIDTNYLILFAFTALNYQRPALICLFASQIDRCFRKRLDVIIWVQLLNRKWIKCNIRNTILDFLCDHPSAHSFSLDLTISFLQISFVPLIPDNKT